MIKDEFVKQNYFSRIFSFYFAPTWRSALTILYLLFFSYFAVFYAGNLWLALKFIWHTIINSGSLLGLSYLLWGVVFLITLIVPFSISLYSILLFYEIWRKDWSRNEKILSILMIIILVPFVIVMMDDIVRIAASQGVLRSFVLENNLNVAGY
ncbi:MAG: hypothetical protein PHC85_00880 [Candidatus Pacebacteria bacterium]|nr:hypothetical protein [Candidatus Paceibacterota bacterium]